MENLLKKDSRKLTIQKALSVETVRWELKGHKNRMTFNTGYHLSIKNIKIRSTYT